MFCVIKTSQGICRLKTEYRTGIMQEDMQFTEQSLREALERLGSKSDKNSSRKLDHAREESASRPFYAGMSTSGNSGKKRRFVNDGGVVVEHRNDLGRRNRRVVTADKAGTERSESGEQQEEVIELRKNLVREQQRGVSAEAEIEELKEKIRSLETRLVHYQFQLEEREKKLNLLKEENGRLKLREGRQIVTVPDVPVLRRKAKVIASSSVKGLEEQEPVKWWSGE